MALSLVVRGAKIAKVVAPNGWARFVGDSATFTAGTMGHASVRPQATIGEATAAGTAVGAASSAAWAKAGGRTRGAVYGAVTGAMFAAVGRAIRDARATPPPPVKTSTDRTAPYVDRTGRNYANGRAIPRRSQV